MPQVKLTTPNTSFTSPAAPLHQHHPSPDSNRHDSDGPPTRTNSQKPAGHSAILKKAINQFLSQNLRQNFEATQKTLQDLNNKKDEDEDEEE